MKVWHCDRRHTVTFPNMFVLSYPLLQVSQMTYSVTWVTKLAFHIFKAWMFNHKQHSIFLKNVTLWTLSHCHISKYYFCSFSGVTNLTTDLQVWHVSQNNHVTLSKHQWFIQINVPFLLKMWHCDSCHSVTIPNIIFGHFLLSQMHYQSERVNVWHLSQ